MKKLLLLFFIFISVNHYALGSDDLLKVEKAFQISVKAESKDSITVSWDITEGYYLYRERIVFSSNTEGIVLGTPLLPEGEIKEEPAIGKLAIYRNNIAIKIPITNNSNVDKLKLKVKYQGCFEPRGVCYPPQKVSVVVTLPRSLPEATAPIAGITGESSPSDLADIIGMSKAKGGTLPADEAFAFDISALGKHTLNAHWQVTPGHYLYQHKIKFSLKRSKSKGLTLGKITLPKGNPHHDEYFGDIITYDKDFDIKLPLEGDGDTVTIKAMYQGCSSITKICYPPQHKTQTIDLSTLKNTSPAKLMGLTGIDETTTSSDTTKISKQGEFENILKSKNLLTILGVFFLAGLALTFTPCVFPMIPILSGIISGQGKDISKKKAFILSLAYVIPMALTYAIVGVLAGLSGESLTTALQTPWVIASFAALFVLLSFAMFGFYELQMPSSVQNKLMSISNNQRGGTLVGAAIMGMLSALIVGPCVTAPLTGALIFIADTKDALLGGLSLFMLGIGMGVPLLIIGTAAGEFLPRAGAWMDKVKAVFGVLMLGLAIWMLERILPIEATIILTAVLLIGSAIYMRALDSLDNDSSGWNRLWKALGIILLAYGLMLIIGIAKGNKSFLLPLKDRATVQINGSNALASEGLVFKTIKGIKGLEQALEVASTQNKTVMFDFYADWCVSCKEMEHNAFSDPRVIAALKQTVLIQADVTKHDALDAALLKKFGLFGPPAILFFDTNKKEQEPFRVVGEMGADEFLAHVNEYLTTQK